MTTALRQPRWIIAGGVVLILAALFVRLGFWQLSRLEERRLGNEIGEMRLSADSLSLELLLEQAGDDLESLQFRRALVSGAWDTSEEVLIRSQVELGTAGFHVITPLVMDGGTAVLVNRGWVPLALDSPPIAEAAPESEEHEVVGWVHLTETRPPLGAEEPPGRLQVFNRVDIERISSQMPYEALPVYLVVTGEEDDFPVPVDLPDFTNEGPHLAYAIQWFGFALVGVVGFYFLYRKKGRQST